MKYLIGLFLILFSAGSIHAQWFKKNRDASICPEGYIPIPAGSFRMGDNFENIFKMPVNVRKVSISNFFFKKTEVTNEEYKEFVEWVKDSLGIGGDYSRSEIIYQINEKQEIGIIPDSSVWSNTRDNYAPAYFSYFTNDKYKNYPVVGITFEQAQAYCHWLTLIDKNSERIFHLPTEAQWEYAAGIAKDNGKRNKFPWPGADCKTMKGLRTANYKIGPGQYVGAGSGEVIYTKRVKEYFPSFIGLYDLGGNVAEWCMDSYIPVYSDVDKDPVYVDRNSEIKVIRGGSWKAPWYFMQGAARCFAPKSIPRNYIGFRPAATIIGAKSRHEMYKKYFK
ncbi:MAG: SUMF1/EgtB/PvdO family nonheme iron enzyme [Bacteroidota bacterium]|nr:SUMF1/EgtB/PvdO family nonheme iron enzyme [Bacteroidota bacterium]